MGWGYPRKDTGPVEVLWDEDGVSAACEETHTFENSSFPILPLRAVMSNFIPLKLYITLLILLNPKTRPDVNFNISVFDHIKFNNVALDICK